MNGENNLVNHPKHYNQGSIECIDAIESMLGWEGFRDFLRGQVVKYNWRLSHKEQDVLDVGKAKWYQDRLDSHMKKEKK